jgi:hypothetical protein
MAIYWICYANSHMQQHTNIFINNPLSASARKATPELVFLPRDPFSLYHKNDLFSGQQNNTLTKHIGRNERDGLLIFTNRNCYFDSRDFAQINAHFGKRASRHLQPRRSPGCIPDEQSRCGGEIPVLVGGYYHKSVNLWNPWLMSSKERNSRLSRGVKY